ncbi:unnamed protein product [Effrenium voratum]|uniref:Uncharacterized protein n=1 Tax=Effrenium voratum TaxID=2562239 RepID=A0AA36HMN5_9DINO|nr:unnamed protein product [Effrenium voratum]
MLRLRAAQREGLRDGLLYQQLLRQLLEGEGEHQWQAQLQLKRDVLEDELLQVFPPLPSARRCLARAVVQELETLEEVEDDLFKLCTEEASKSTGLGLQGHKIFEIGQGLVVLRVAEQIGGGLETGCVIWTGGCMLLGLCLSGAMDHLLTGHILELGAGCGLLGLSLALQGSQVTLSDAQPQVLDNLMYNVEATKRCKGQAAWLQEALPSPQSSERAVNIGGNPTTQGRTCGWKWLTWTGASQRISKWTCSSAATWPTTPRRCRPWRHC